MTQKTKAIMMVFGLTHQLSAWIDYSRSLGYMTQSFKQESGILSRQCHKFISMFGAQDEEVYEHSVQISELFEKLAKMDEYDIKRVVGLINKIEQTKTNKHVHANSL
jgi:HD-GYP domain-containing protein (c-di-GMP phosphodiesterase class II)